MPYHTVIKHLRQSNFILKGSYPLSAMSYINQAIVITLGLGLISAVVFSAFAADTQSMSFVLSEINKFHKDILGEKFTILSVDVIGESAVITIANYGVKESSIIAILDDTGEKLACTTNNADETDHTVLENQMIEITCTHSGSEKFYVVTETRQILVAIP